MGVIHATAVIDPQAELAPDVRVGPHSIIGPEVTIGAGAEIGAHVAHDCVLGDHVIVTNYAGLTRHIVIEDRVTIGGLTGIRPFGRIGTYACIGGYSKVTQDVPPFENSKHGVLSDPSRGVRERAEVVEEGIP